MVERTDAGPGQVLRVLMAAALGAIAFVQVARFILDASSPGWSQRPAGEDYIRGIERMFEPAKKPRGD